MSLWLPWLPGLTRPGFGASAASRYRLRMARRPGGAAASSPNGTASGAGRLSGTLRSSIAAFLFQRSQQGLHGLQTDFTLALDENQGGRILPLGGNFPPGDGIAIRKAQLAIEPAGQRAGRLLQRRQQG